MPDFSCGKRGADGTCGDTAHALTTLLLPACSHCCFGCQHAIDMDCTAVCPTVDEHYYPEE